MIRELTADDIPEVLSRLHDAAHESGWIRDLVWDPAFIAQHLAAMIERDQYLVIGSDDGGALMIAEVYQNWYSPSLVAHEKLIYVHPALRQQGIARALIEHYVAWAKQRGAIKAGIAVNLGIAPEKVRLLFESCGFQWQGHTFEMLLGD